MTLQYSVAVRNARLDVVETTIGTAARLKIFTGAPPENCAAADAGTVLADITLPSDWLGNAADGVKAKAGTWQDTSANASGVAGHFRIYDSGVSACHAQGTITGSGGGGDMEVDNVNLVETEAFTVTSFAITAGNA